MRLQRVLLSVLLALFTTPLFAGETVSHQQLGLRLTVPDGFEQNLERVQDKVILAFHRPPSEEGHIGTFILIRRLGAVIGRERFSQKELAAKSPQLTISTEKWKTFDVDAVRVPEKHGDTPVITFNVQVPLKPEAIQVAVIGEAGDEEQLRTILRQVLASLDGETNWLNETQRSEKIVEGATRLIITCAVLVGIAVFIWQMIRRSSKSTSDRRDSNPRSRHRPRRTFRERENEESDSDDRYPSRRRQRDED